MPRRRERRPAVAVVGDLHANSELGLFPPEFITDSGQRIRQNAVQRFLWLSWTSYWTTVRERYAVEAVIVNGDALNGVNARDAQNVTYKESDQQRIGEAVLQPALSAKAPLYMLRGTGFHAGKAGAHEEQLAAAVGAVPDEHGRQSRWTLWLEWRGKLIFATHHISNAAVYPYTPLSKERNKALARSHGGRWLMPDVDVRSHVHRSNAVQGNDGRWNATVPAWQLSTEFVHKVAAGDLPDIGGAIIWLDEDGAAQVRRITYPLPLPRVERLKR